MKDLSGPHQQRTTAVASDQDADFADSPAMVDATRANRSRAGLLVQGLAQVGYASVETKPTRMPYDPVPDFQGGRTSDGEILRSPRFSVRMPLH